MTVTNVPGSETTLYAFGAPLRRVVPLVPLAAEHAVAVAALSYDGTVFFCVHADRDAAPDAHRVVEGIEAELDALGWSPREPQRRRRARPPSRARRRAGDRHRVRTRHVRVSVRHTDACCGRAPIAPRPARGTVASMWWQMPVTPAPRVFQTLASAMTARSSSRPTDPAASA